MKSRVLNPVLCAGIAATVALAAGCDRDREPTTAPKADTAAPTTQPTGAAGGSDRQTTYGNGGNGQASGSGDRTAGGAMDDGMITAKVKAALMADDEIKGLKINVDTRNGVVTLGGEVQSQAQVTRALEIAGRVEGVRQVDNQLRVRGG